MRKPRRVAARMAGAIVAALLAAAPSAAAADDAPLLLLPEAADEGAIDAKDAPSAAEGSAIGGAPAEAVSAEATAGAEEKAAAPDAPDTGSMDRAEAASAPASRLLRALAEAAKAPASPDNGVAGMLRVSGTSVPGTSVYAAEGCPRALLRRLLAGAADDAGALTALGIEREVLTLCRERQEIVTGLFETEARLRELRAASEPPLPARTSAAVALQPAPEVRESAVSGQAQPSPLRAALAATAGKADEADSRAAEAQAPAQVSPAQVSSTRVSPRYAWFSIIGTAGALRAGVTDGTGAWFVREGDALPGGARVTAIVGRPPAVQVSVPGETLVSGTGEQWPLPYRARPAGNP